MRFTYSLMAISIMLNVYLIFSSLPARKELIDFWKEQATRWRERYFELLNFNDNAKKESWTERLQRFNRENPGIDPDEAEDRGREDITG